MSKSVRPHTLAALLAIAGLGCAAAPAMAKATRSADDATQLTVKKKGGETLYCLRETPKTGSIMTKETCLTRQGWAEKGLTFPAAEAAVSPNKGQPEG